MDRLTNLEVFNKVVETGSFTAAAERLGLSRAAVSKHIMQLEDRIGVRLLNRTTRRVSPTEMGRAYYDRTARILADLEDADHAVSVLQSEPKGKLRVTAPNSFASNVLGRVATEFLKRYPEIELDFILNDRVVDIVEEGLDLAIRIGDLTDSSLIARRLAPFRRALVASPAYIAEFGGPQSLEDLRKHNCLRYYFPGRYPGWRFVAPDGTERVFEPAGRFAVNNGVVGVEAAVQGLGIGFVPTFIAGAYIRDGKLVPLLPQWKPREVSIHAVYPPNRHLSAKVRVLIDFLVERWSPEPEWDRGIIDLLAA